MAIEILGTNPFRYVKREGVKLLPMAFMEATYAVISLSTGQFICYIKAMGEDWNPDEDEHVEKE